jgi:hypothetical protein
MSALRNRLIGAGLLTLTALALLPAISQAAARSSRYAPNPTARNFNGGAGGWNYSQSSAGLCVPALLCPVITNSHRQSGGNGYLQTRLGALLGVGATSKGILTSPAFTYRGAAGRVPSSLSLSLRLRSNVGQLLAVTGNSATYEVELENRATKQRTEVIPARSLEGADSWTARRASLNPSQLKVGDRYRIRIATTYNTGATVLPGGAADYDNVALLARRARGSGGPGGSGGTLSSSQLRVLVLQVRPHWVKHRRNRLFVRLRCPKRVHARCKVAASAYLRRHGAKVGHTRRVRIAAGHKRMVALHVKRRYRAKVLKRRRILIKERVRARGARAKVSFRVKLIHR